MKLTAIDILIILVYLISTVVIGLVLKKVAQKIFIDTPNVDEVETLEMKSALVENEYESYYKTAQTYLTIMPNVKGLPAMDAVALLENMGLKVKLSGSGVVIKQSVDKGIKIKKNQTVVLETS